MMFLDPAVYETIYVSDPEVARVVFQNFSRGPTLKMIQKTSGAQSLFNTDDCMFENGSKMLHYITMNDEDGILDLIW